MRPASQDSGSSLVSFLRRVIRFLSAVAALCALAAFPGSSLFALREVTVAGNTTVPSGEILDRAGVHAGDNVFRVDAAAVVRRLRQDPRIAAAWVEIHVPWRLRIVVRERIPVAALLAGDGVVLLGADGVAIARAADPGSAVPLQVDGLDLTWVTPGTVVPSDAVRRGAAVSAALPAPLRSQVARVRVDAAGQVALELKDGTAVRLGDGRGLWDRLALVPQVLATLRQRGMAAEYVDLRFPGSVIVRPASAPGGTGEAPAGTSGPTERKENAPPRGISPAIQRPSTP